jgi:hypothetical protein
MLRYAWPMKMKPMLSPEASVSNHLTARNNTEDGRTSSTATEACDLS